MFCSKCGKELNADAAFCIQCGNKLDGRKTQNIVQWLLAGLGALLGVIALLFWFVANQDSTSAAKKDLETTTPVEIASPTVTPTATPKPTPKATPEPTSTPEPEAEIAMTPTPIRVAWPTPVTSLPTPIWSAGEGLKVLISPISADTIVLEPGHFRFIPITRNPKMLNPQLRGGFRAIGGDNVEVFVVDGIGLENLKAGQRFRSYYSSGRVLTERITVDLPDAPVFVVFSNTYSVFSRKTVKYALSIAFSEYR